MAEELRAWLGRLAIAGLLGIAIGLLAYTLARAGTSVWLLFEQQALIQELGTTIQGNAGIEGLAQGNLRQLRIVLESQARYYAQLSAQIGFGSGALSMLLSYLWLERRAATRRR